MYIGHPLCRGTGMFVGSSNSPPPLSFLFLVPPLNSCANAAGACTDAAVVEPQTTRGNYVGVTLNYCYSVKTIRLEDSGERPLSFSIKFSNETHVSDRLGICEGKSYTCRTLYRASKGTYHATISLLPHVIYSSVISSTDCTVFSILQNQLSYKLPLRPKSDVK